MTDTKNRQKFLPLIAPKLRSFAALMVIGAVLSSCSDETSSEIAENSCDYAVASAKKLEGSIKGDMAAFIPIEQPISLSTIPFVTAEGKEQTLADYSGKTLLVNLWATWCAPCRAEMPALEHLESQLGGGSFLVLPISVDHGSSEKPKAFYKEIGLTKLPFLHDISKTAFKTFQKNSLALGLPATVLVDPKGCVLGKLNGPAEWGGKDALTLVKAAINLK
ncbi:MAG: sodium:dicarboxylate symporter [Hyphomicrobiales bacterium]|nr:MAG: sodium:dicarboxylate symporter [Hyphomicrobiales bacterium]